MTQSQLFLLLFGLGLYHGINPAMGWLLAASQGLQNKSLSHLMGALQALTIGHFAAVALAVLGYVHLVKFMPQHLLEWIVAGLLIGFGAYHLVNRKHAAWLGMRSGLAAVALWSFLIASAHGAGLMLLPFIGNESTSWTNTLLLILVHTAGYLLASSIAALFIYGTLNLQVLKSAWINFDLFWAYSLLLTGLFYIFFFLL